MDLPEKLSFYVLLVAIGALQIFQIQKNIEILEVFSFLHQPGVPSDYIKVSSVRKRVDRKGVKKKEIQQEEGPRQPSPNPSLQEAH